MTPIPRRIELTLYQLDRRSTAVWLSPDGTYSQARWCPLRYVGCPPTLTPVKVGGIPLQQGVFCVEEWKLKEFGWMQQGEDERQGELL